MLGENGTLIFEYVKGGKEKDRSNGDGGGKKNCKML